MHVLVVEPLGMPTSDAYQAGHGLFGNMHKTGCCPDATAFTEMIDHSLGFGLRKLRVE
jgi:hypothetical protein